MILRDLTVKIKSRIHKTMIYRDVFVIGSGINCFIFENLYESGGDTCTPRK